MKLRSFLTTALICLIGLGLVITPALAKKPSLDAWKAKFDPSGAKYKIVVSNVSHPQTLFHAGR